MKEYIKRIGVKGMMAMMIGNCIVALGVSLFRISTMGNDPFNALCMSVGIVSPLSFGIFLWILNAGLFVVQLITGRETIGPGTVFNALLNGWIVTFFLFVFEKADLIPTALLPRIVVFLIGVVVCSFGLAMYQSSDAGTAPYDALPIICDARTKPSYFAWRMIFDCCCAAVAIMLGGIGFKLIGIGTIVSALCVGPIVQLFTEKLVKPYILKY